MSMQDGVKLIIWLRGETLDKVSPLMQMDVVSPLSVQITSFNSLPFFFVLFNLHLNAPIFRLSGSE